MLFRKLAQADETKKKYQFSVEIKTVLYVRPRV